MWQIQRKYFLVVSLLIHLNLVFTLPYPSSTPGGDHKCESSDKSKPSRYHNETEKCYRVNNKGPCEENLIFHLIDSIYGDCDCSVTDNDVPSVYHAETNMCYKIFDQAFCSIDQWLVFDDNNNPVCESNKCRIETERTQKSESKIVLYKGQCVQLWEASSLCEPNQIVSFVPNSTTPSCIDEHGFFNIGGSALNLKCRVGSRSYVTRKCRTSIVQHNFGR